MRKRDTLRRGGAGYTRKHSKQKGTSSRIGRTLKKDRMNWWSRQSPRKGYWKGWRDSDKNSGTIDIKTLASDRTTVQGTLEKCADEVYHWCIENGSQRRWTTPQGHIKWEGSCRMAWSHEKRRPDPEKDEMLDKTRSRSIHKVLHSKFVSEKRYPNGNIDKYNARLFICGNWGFIMRRKFFLQFRNFQLLNYFSVRPSNMDSTRNILTCRTYPLMRYSSGQY